jgi:hypothetical protein
MIQNLQTHNLLFLFGCWENVGMVKKHTDSKRNNQKNCINTQKILFPSLPWQAEEKRNTDSKAENQPTEIPSTANKPCSQDKPYPTEEVL